MWKVFLAATSLVLLIAACSSTDKGESCSDEGRLSGDCNTGLLCTRKDDDDTSELVCLTPCLNQADCLVTETCSGRKNFTACHPKGP